MPVTVTVPLTIRLRGEPRSAELQDLQAAIASATRDALDESRRRVLDPRGGRPVRVAPPRLSVDGALRPDLRDLVAAAVRGGVDRAVRDSGILEPRESGLPAALSGRRVAERADAARLDRERGLYRIPVFDDGDEEPVPVATDPPAEPDSGVVTLGQALRRAWEAHLRRAGRPAWDPAAYGYPGYYGTIRFPNGVGTMLVYINSVEYFDERGNPRNARWKSTDITLFMQRAGRADPTRAPSRIASGRESTLRRTEEPVTIDAVAALIREARPKVSEAQARILAAAVLRGRGELVFWELDGERLPGPTGLDSPIHFVVGTYERRTEEAEEEPEGGVGLRREGAEEAEEGEGAGGAGRPGAGGAGEGRTPAGAPGGVPGGEGEEGPAGGPLGEGPEGAGGRIWPSSGLGGETLVCESFEGEPSLEELDVGGPALRESMLRLAAKLGAPECEYAAQFALNCAKLLGARARDVALADIAAGTTTRVTVRPAGDGNHGVVDIQATATPGIQYLQVLAETIPLLADFANDVYGVYRAPENRGSDAISWGIDFLSTFNWEITSGCMHLYAETCRVILMQQLRSSREFIEARRGDFERTKQHFDIALGIMGESIERLIVLQRALRAARIGEAQAGSPFAGPLAPTLGLVQALAGPASLNDYLLTARDAYQSVRLLDPATFTALLDAQIVREGDSFVAIWQGRRWTDQDLAEAIRFRRGLLNTIDPLFLQVENIEVLSRDYRGDPESTREYLRELLDEMAEANAELIEDSSDPGDGAFFALETTRYVAAQGGANSRGLRFDLHGLHGLADDQLRPHSGDHYFYRRGIDRAIGRKAGFDQMIAVFSTGGIILLGVICAPLGVVAAGAITGGAGLGLAAYDYYRATEREEVYRALEDPEAILSWQEVQLEYFMAGLSAAFSVFDVVGVGRGARAAVAGARTALREAGEQGARRALRASIRSEYDRILRNMSGEVMEQAVRQAMLSVALDQVLSPLLQVVISPVITSLQQAGAVEHGAGVTAETLRAAAAARAPEDDDLAEFDIDDIEFVRVEGGE